MKRIFLTLASDEELKGIRHYAELSDEELDVVYDALIESESELANKILHKIFFMVRNTEYKPAPVLQKNNGETS